MEAIYFRNQLRSYNVVLAILKAESEDDFCLNCIGLEGAIIKVEKGLKKLKSDLMELVDAEQERADIMAQIDRLSQQVSGLPLREEPI